MSNALTETLPGSLANPLRQVSGLMSQPAVRRAMPFLFLVGLIAAGWIAWSMVAASPQRILFANLNDADKSSVTAALDTGGIKSNVDNSGSLTVAEDDYHKARMLLASQDLPKSQPGGYQILDQLPMGVSRAVEGERLRQARETELAKSIQEIDAIAEARVHLATPEASVFVRDHAAPSASVIVKLQPGRSLGEAQIRAVVNLVASSVPGMAPENVTIVDQMGALLSKSGGAGADSAGDARIDFQKRVEDKYREQLTQLLTPLVGSGNFSVEVQADVDLNESQATRESYDKDGQVVRAEQGNWTGNGSANGAAPGGIPGALSNTPPPPSTMTAPNAQPTPAPNAAASTPGAAPAATPAAPAQKQSDSFTRTYDLGKEISVTRAAPGAVKRVSAAILLREEPGKPRGQVEIGQITQLVRAAVGFDQNRGDNVTVISRKFTGATDAATSGPSWYDAGWVPLLARNATALIIALLVLFLGVRPLAKALLKKRDEPSPHRAALANPGYAQQQPGAAPQPAVSIDMLDKGGKGYDDRVGLVRGFTRDNPARAALAVRDMIKAGRRMSMLRSFNGVERAAVLMMLVGEDEAATILQKLDPEEVRQLGKAMYDVADVSEAEVEQVLDDFTYKARERNGITFDPGPKIETMMNRALGPERAESVLARIMPAQAQAGIELLEWFEPVEIAAMIEEEHPQIAAVLLAQLDPDIAAKVFENLPEAVQPQILRRIAKLGPVPPEAIETLKVMLASRAGAAKKPSAGLQMGGTREAAKILSGARKSVEIKVMPKLAKIDRDVARAIEEAMFVFDNLLDLDDKNLSTLIRSIDGDVLTRALKGVEEDIRERFLGCMSSRAADGIRDEMEARGPMKLAEVLDAQKTMIAIARGLIKDGTLQMAGKGGEDDYV